MNQQVNIVLGGGGMKGIGLVGALAAIADGGWEFSTLAGNSAGAIVAALVAAGMTPTQINELMNDLDFLSLLDTSGANGRWGLAVQGLSVVRTTAAHSGEKLLRWMIELLDMQGVRHFGDLRIGGNDVPMEERYGLVVIAADLSHGRLLRLPWDFHLLGLDPDRQSVAGAVRAATALPLLYQPYRMGNAILADGGIVTNFPVGIMRDFLRRHEPTIGVHLSFAPEVEELHPEIRGLSSLARAAIITSMNAQSEEVLRDPEISNNSIMIDVDGVKITDFSISKAQQRKLYNNGYLAASKFLQTWHPPATSSCQ